MSTVMTHSIENFTQILQTISLNETDVSELIANLTSKVSADIMVATQQFANGRKDNKFMKLFADYCNQSLLKWVRKLLKSKVN